MLIERVAYRPLRAAPKLAPLITAVGFSFILQNVGLLWNGGSPFGVNDLIHQGQTVFSISGVPIVRGYLLALAVMIPLVFGLAWFINSTRAGRAMRATAQDPEAARLMGINVNQTISLTFLLGGMLAGAAGLVYALYETNVWYFQGFKAGLIAFTAAVMGGIGNVRGAVLGGLIIGVIQALSDARLGPAVDGGGRVRLPHRDHDPAPARTAGRGDEGGRMSPSDTPTPPLDRRLRRAARAAGEWRAGIERRLPPWWSRALAGALLVIGIVLPFLFSNNSGFMNATIIALAFAVMSLGLNVVVGFAGLLDLGYVAFYALGAYSLGWFGSDFFFKAKVHVGVHGVAATEQGIHLNFILILIAAALICAIAGMIIGLPTLRLRGDYIAIVTLAFGEIIGVVAVNGQSVQLGGGMTLTAGNLGISAVDAPYFPGIGQFNLLNLRPWYWLIFAILLIVLAVNVRLRDSRLGRAWVALREDEVAAVSMGIPSVRDQALGLRHRGHVRRHVRGVPGHLLHDGQRGTVPVRLLDLHPGDGDHRRPGLDLGRAARRDAAGLHQQLAHPRRAQRRCPRSSGSTSP